VQLIFIEEASLQHVNVLCDDKRLLQVLSNLLSNAVKFSPDHGQVQIDCVGSGLDNQTIKVMISDQGPGIPAGFHSRIFQKFSQADSSDVRLKGGTGLGLAISRELIEQMGGTIGFTSEAGQGACFYIELPVVS
jgi:signal transduction histidine kinase